MLYQTKHFSFAHKEYFFWPNPSNPKQADLLINTCKLCQATWQTPGGGREEAEAEIGSGITAGQDVAGGGEQISMHLPGIWFVTQGVQMIIEKSLSCACVHLLLQPLPLILAIVLAPTACPPRGVGVQSWFVWPLDWPAPPTFGPLVWPPAFPHPVLAFDTKARDATVQSEKNMKKI